jgi:hypothetical protein
MTWGSKRTFSKRSSSSCSSSALLARTVTLLKSDLLFLYFFVLSRSAGSRPVHGRCGAEEEEEEEARQVSYPNCCVLSKNNPFESSLPTLTMTRNETPPATSTHRLDAELERALSRHPFTWIDKQPGADRERRDVEHQINIVRHRGCVDSPLRRLVRQKLLARGTRGHPGCSEAQRRRQTTVQRRPERLEGTPRAQRNFFSFFPKKIPERTSNGILFCGFVSQAEGPDWLRSEVRGFYTGPPPGVVLTARQATPRARVHQGLEREA